MSRRVFYTLFVFSLLTTHYFHSPLCAQDSAESNQTQPPSSLLTESSDGYFQLPWLTENNMDRCLDEIKERGISRLQLDRIGFGERPSELLHQLIDASHHVDGLTLRNSMLTHEDLYLILSELPRLKTLRLTGCRLTPKLSGQDTDIEWESVMTQITHFSVSYCRGIDNETIGRFLTIMSRLEELGLYDSEELPGGDFNGEGWPLNQLTRLRELSIATPAGDEFVHRLLSDCPNLATLKLWGCNALKGEDWPAAALEKLKILEFMGCEQLSANQVSSLLTHAPQLESLTFHSYPDEDHGVLDLTGLVELKDLNIRGAKNRVRGLESLSSLQSLSMYGVQIVEEKGVDFSRLPDLAELALDSCGPLQLETLGSNVESLSLGNFRLGNSDLKQLLTKLVNLRSLTLFSIYSERGNASDSDAITGVDWDFSELKELREIEFINLRFLSDQLVIRIAEQLSDLEWLHIANADSLTGTAWNLSALTNLKRLEFNDIPLLRNDVVMDLPASIESLNITSCEGITGENWDLSSLSRLSEMKLRRCQNLTSIGSRLPSSLIELGVWDCRRLRASDIDYSGIEQLRSLSFWECHDLDVDRLFEALPKHANSLRTLDLTGCPDLSLDGWDLSPMKNSLHEIVYPEGEPSYVGGIGEVNAQILQRQLPLTRIKR